MLQSSTVEGFSRGDEGENHAASGMQTQPPPTGNSFIHKTTFYILLLLLVLVYM